MSGDGHWYCYCKCYTGSCTVGVDLDGDNNPEDMNSFHLYFYSWNNCMDRECLCYYYEVDMMSLVVVAVVSDVPTAPQCPLQYKDWVGIASLLLLRW